MTHTLLLADDSVTIQRVIELTFADEDVQVIAVSDGDQAIERLEASPPDIVLADIGMPGRNGYEVAQYIKQSPRLAHIPVVLLTGAFEPVDQARASEAGCDGVLAKPFEPQLVISRVKDLLAKGRQVRVAFECLLNRGLLGQRRTFDRVMIRLQLPCSRLTSECGAQSRCDDVRTHMPPFHGAGSREPTDART